MKAFWGVMEDRRMVRVAWIAVAVYAAFVVLVALAANRPAVQCPPERPVHRGQECVAMPSPYTEPPVPTASPR